MTMPPFSDLLRLIPIWEVLRLGTTLTIFACGLFVTIRHFRIVRAISFSERLNTNAMIEVRTAIEHWLSSSPDDEKRLQNLSADKQLQFRLHLLINVLTEMAIACRLRMVHRGVIRSAWAGVCSKYWQRLGFYLRDRRSRGAFVGYNFELMVADMAERDGVPLFPPGHGAKLRKLLRRRIGVIDLRESEQSGESGDGY